MADGNKPVLDYMETDLRIVTNGLRIEKLPEETLLAVKKYNCRFDISNYPVTRKHLPAIKQRLEASGVADFLLFAVSPVFSIIRQPLPCS